MIGIGKEGKVRGKNRLRREEYIIIYNNIIYNIIICIIYNMYNNSIVCNIII